ncbi:MAG: hypothetical protein ABL879_05785 [Devosia sp.]
MRRLTAIELQDPRVEQQAITEEWENMLTRVAIRSFENERRLERAEKALNRLSLN